MSAAAVLAALALAAQDEPEAPPPPAVNAPAGAPPHSGPPQSAPPQSAPRTIDELLDQTPMSEDQREAAVRAAYAAAQARRGALDGRWRLQDRAGATLYVFQLSDPGDLPDPRSATPRTPVIEGAWSDPARARGPGDSGFLAQVERDGARLVLRFVDHDPDRPQVVTLHLRGDGAWTGELAGEAAPRPVVLTRE